MLQSKAAGLSAPAPAAAVPGDPVTADPYAAAAGLVARSAAAYASSIPEHPADDGFFGPGQRHLAGEYRPVQPGGRAAGAA